MLIMYRAAIEIAYLRWSLAQELKLHAYPEQDQDAQLIESTFGRLPE